MYDLVVAILVWLVDQVPGIRDGQMGLRHPSSLFLLLVGAVIVIGYLHFINRGDKRRAEDR